MIKKFRRIALGVLAVGISFNLWGCSGGGAGIIDGISVTPADPNAPVTLPTPTVPVTVPKFDPASGDPTKLPLPNDLLRDPKTGFVNQFPATPPFNAEPFLSLASMQGFSTTGNIVIPFTGPIVQSSVNNSAIRLLDTTTNATVNCTFTVLNPFVAGKPGDSTVIASPIKALASNRTYVVVITPELQGSDGAVSPTATINLIKNATPLVDATNTSLISGLDSVNATKAEVLRAAYQPIWQRAETASGLKRADMVLAFQFGTQPLFFTLQTMRAVAVAENRGLVNNTLQASNAAGNVVNVTTFYQGALNVSAPVASAASAGVFRIFAGQVNMPDYIGNPVTGFFTGSATPANASAPLGSPQNPVVRKNDRPVPFFCCLPNPVTFPGPRPTIIFQHGITRNKGDVFAIAGTACSLGFAIIAIDHPLHGSLAIPGQPSGTGFINLSSLRTGRDNLRQSTVDLFYLTQAIVSGQTNLDGVAGPELAPIKPFFIGQSLGSIVGVNYTAVDANSAFAALNVPGGRLSQLLLASPSFAPTILAGLAAQGIQANTSTFTQFWLIAQTVLDDGEPMNYATVAINGALKGGVGSRILVQEALADTTITNSATEDLVVSMNGISQVNATNIIPLLPQVSAPFAGSGIFQFPGAKHGFLLDPTQGTANSITAGRTQVFTFFATAGNIIFPPGPFPKELEVAPGSDTNDYSSSVYFNK